VCTADAGDVDSGPLVTPDQGEGAGSTHVTPDQGGEIDVPTVVVNGGQTAAEVAEKIAKGHAWGKHVVKKGEFDGIVSDEKEFKELVERIISKPSESKSLENGRTAYWDDATGSVVIANPNDKDGGTCFRPGSGKEYYDEELK
jgi:hypothetical protein